MKAIKNKHNQFSIFHLTWPIFLELFLFMLMGLMDTFMLSAVSDEAAAGVGAANQYIQIAILLLEVVGIGAAIVVAQYLGSRKFQEASQISALAITMNILLGLVISSYFIFFADELMSVLHVQGDVYNYASQYLFIVGGGIFLQALINVSAAIIRVHGATKQVMYVSFGMNIIHVILNYLLIFGTLGFPELGVKGAAISSIVSRLIVLLVFIWMLYNTMEVRIQLHDYKNFSKDYVKKILSIGFPAAIEQVMYQACQLVFLFYATFLGAEALAARQYAMNISMFTYLFAAAIGMGTAIIVGRRVGANEKMEAYEQVWKSVKWAFGVTVLMVLLVAIFRYPLMDLFTDNPTVIEMGVSVLLLSVLLETGRTFNIVIINSLRAAGDAKFPVIVGGFSMVLGSLSLGYLFTFHFHMGLTGIWLAIAIDEWTRGIIMSFRWRSKKWEKYALVSTENKSAPTVGIESA